MCLKFCALTIWAKVPEVKRAQDLGTNGVMSALKVLLYPRKSLVVAFTYCVSCCVPGFIEGFSTWGLCLHIKVANIRATLVLFTHHPVGKSLEGVYLPSGKRKQAERKYLHITMLLLQSSHHFKAGEIKADIYLCYTTVRLRHAAMWKWLPSYTTSRLWADRVQRILEGCVSSRELHG